MLHAPALVMGEERKRREAKRKRGKEKQSK